MRLVGATDRQIHLPYLIEGSLQGASGAFGALLSLNAVVAALNSLVQASPVVGMLVPEVSGVDLKVGSLILLVGLGVGLAGSYASVRKFLVD